MRGGSGAGGVEDRAAARAGGEALIRVADELGAGGKSESNKTHRGYP